MRRAFVLVVAGVLVGCSSGDDPGFPGTSIPGDTVVDAEEAALGEASYTIGLLEHVTRIQSAVLALSLAEPFLEGDLASVQAGVDDALGEVGSALATLQAIVPPEARAEAHAALLVAVRSVQAALAAMREAAAADDEASLEAAREALAEASDAFDDSVAAANA